MTTHGAAKESVHPQLSVLAKSRDSLRLNLVKSCAHPEPSSVARTLNAQIDITHSLSVWKKKKVSISSSVMSDSL